MKVLQCSQVDAPKLDALAREIGPFDFIIDDGSHLNAHQIETFGILWPHLKDGGTYIVEDVQTSYWPAYGGGLLGTPAYARSCMHWFKNLADSVNLPEFLEPAPAGLDPGIASIAFHHNLIVVRKDLPSSLRSAIQESLVTMRERNPNVFKEIGAWLGGFVPADDGKYQVIRELNDTAKKLAAQK